MAIMSIDLKEAGGLIGTTLVSKYVPDLLTQLGYQEGYRTAKAEKDEKEPLHYKSEIKNLQVACPLFKGYRGAISIRVDGLVQQDLVYSPGFLEKLNRMANRFAMVTAPAEDGSFMVLFVQSHPDDSDDVQDRVYDYTKARSGGITEPFFDVAKDIMDFLIDGTF